MRGLQVGGKSMPKRLISFFKGNEDAYPGDYLVAIVAVLTIMMAIGAAMLKDMI